MAEASRGYVGFIGDGAWMPVDGHSVCFNSDEDNSVWYGPLTKLADEETGTFTMTLNDYDHDTMASLFKDDKSKMSIGFRHDICKYRHRYIWQYRRERKGSKHRKTRGTRFKITTVVYDAKIEPAVSGRTYFPYIVTGLSGPMWRGSQGNPSIVPRYFNGLNYV